VPSARGARLIDADRPLWLIARQRLFRPVDAVFLVLIVVVAAGVRIPEAVQYVPFAISLVLLGLPHGALDHLVPSRLARRAPEPRGMALIVLLYLLVGGAVVLLWFLNPVLAFALFILTTWFHWGQGDLFVEGTRMGAGAPSRLTRAGMLTVRGALPMIVPLVAAPAVYFAVFQDTTGVIAVPTGDLTPFFESEPLRLSIIAALLLLGVVTFAATARARWGTPEGRRGWWGDLGEVALLAVFFSVVPPILAIGLYFCLWHSLRHIVRLSLLDPGSRPPLSAGRFVVVARRFAVQSAPITVAALGLLVTLFLVVPRAGLSGGALLGLYLVLISSLTLPHVVVVSIMDRRQAVWAG
jgi:Brp/Blh family beta-carotene 15,15'-monooxygenase